MMALMSTFGHIDKRCDFEKLPKMQSRPKGEINISEQSRHQNEYSQISHVICSIAAKYRVYN